MTTKTPEELARELVMTGYLSFVFLDEAEELHKALTESMRDARRKSADTRQVPESMKIILPEKMRQTSFMADEKAIAAALRQYGNERLEEVAKMIEAYRQDEPELIQCCGMRFHLADKTRAIKDKQP